MRTPTLQPVYPPHILLRLLLAVVLGTGLLAGTAQAAQAPKVSVQAITDSLYLLQGRGGNVLASVGSDGVLLIDDDYAEYASAYQQAIETLTGRADAPLFIINTHWHGDHTGGNQFWGEAGAFIVAHNNVLQRLASAQKSVFRDAVTPAAPAAAWPVVTYADSMALHFNDDTLELQHYPSGHTDGDSVVYFTGANVVHMGDLFFKDRFPFVDSGSGGNAAAYLRNVESVLQRVDTASVIVPGHGSIASKADLQRYQQMLLETRAEVQAMQEEGLTLEQMQARGLDDKWASWGGGFIKEPFWISFIAASL